MRIQLLGAAVILSLGASAPSYAAPADAQKDDEGSKIVCKSERFVGTRITERICKTRNEWEQARSSARNALERKTSTQPESRLPTGS